MADAPRQVAVLISCYNNVHDLDACLRSVFASRDNGVQLKVVVVDNGSDEDITPWLHEHFPHVDGVRLEHNRGFTGGNNAGYEHVRQNHPDTDYLVLLNTDTEVESGWLDALVRFMDGHLNAGCAQAKLLLHDQPDTINTAGNRSHYLGFGMMTGYGEPDRGQYDAPRLIDFPSGAAAIIRMSALKQVGLFDETLHLYLEDADLGWKLRQIGYDCALVPEAVVFHKYVPDAPQKHYQHLERNRWLLLLTYHKLPTLLLLAPALLLMEVGQTVYAVITGQSRAKLRSWSWFWRPSHLGHVLRRRSAAQRRRTLSDRNFTADFTGVIDLPTGNPTALSIANVLFGAYWFVARRLIFW